MDLIITSAVIIFAYFTIWFAKEFLKARSEIIELRKQQDAPLEFRLYLEHDKGTDVALLYSEDTGKFLTQSTKVDDIFDWLERRHLHKKVVIHTGNEIIALTLTPKEA